MTKRPDGAPEHDVMAALWDSGRAFAYRAVLNEADLATKRINEVLASSSDRSAVLARFVGTLSKREANRIIDLLQRDR